MTPDALRARIDGVATWQRGDQRAPHKPLLLLTALARFADGTERLPFTEIEAPLRALLRDFGPARAGYHPEYPFWRLQNDGLWVLDGGGDLVRRASNADPTLTSLRTVDPAGRFPDDVAALLRAQPALIEEVAASILDAHFPATLHDDILAAVGLDLGADGSGRRRRRRDPGFRDAVLRAYGYRCAVCGFETRVGHQLVGIDAAHVRWHQAGGAGVDDVSNGVALCALHHRLCWTAARSRSRPRRRTSASWRCLRTRTAAPDSSAGCSTSTDGLSRSRRGRRSASPSRRRHGTGVRSSVAQRASPGTRARRPVRGEKSFVRCSRSV